MKLKIIFVLASLLPTLDYTFAQELRDPTQPSYYSAGDNAYLQRLKENYKLNSVLIGKERRVAIINGNRVQEGDQIEEALVKKINKSSVKLQIPGAVFEINLAGNNLKKLQVKK